MAGEVAHALTQVFGGILLMAAPIAPGIVAGTWKPEGAGVAGFVIVTLAGPLLAGTLFRLLVPRATIWHELPDGQRVEVSRSMKARRIHAAITGAFYTVGAVLCVVS